MKILMVIPLPPLRTLGAAQAQVELAEALRGRGHEVDLLTGLDVFPRPATNRVEPLLRSFARSATPQLRKRARHYDVIDAVEGSVTASKSSLRFNGLLVARSVGLATAYERWRAEAHRRLPATRGRRLGRIPRALHRRYLLWEVAQCHHNADGFFALNNAERDELVSEMGADRVCVLPCGLNDVHRTALAEAARQRSEGVEPHVVFVGTWDARKGCYDFPALVRQILEDLPEARFSFLGTHVSEERVLAELDVLPRSRGRVVPRYEPDDLPTLLSSATVGVFPSYAEGFGIAILEQLAAGLPVAAYDTPGPHDILSGLDDRLLVAPGDIFGLARTVIAAGAGRFVSSDQCIDYVAQFRWESIAERTVRTYERWASMR